MSHFEDRIPHVADAPEGEAAGLAVVRVADIKPQPVRWLWRGYIPLGMVSVIDGHPKLGKSTLTIDLTARVTTGSPMPNSDQRGTPANVILLSAEDSAEHVIRPRLDAAGADPDRVVLVDHVPDPDGARDLELPTDLDRLEALVRAERAALVICDPLMAYLGAGIDSHRDQDVRRALRGFKALAERTGAAFVIVRHYNKGGERNPILRGGGSIGISGAARSVLMVAEHPDDDARRVFALAGGNLGPEPSALAYRIVNDELHDTARVVWEGPTDHKPRDLLGEHGEHGGEPARVEAEEVLREILADGPVPARKVKALARDAGVSERTLDRAREAIGAGYRREGFGPGASYVWELPEDHARQSHGGTEHGEHGEHGSPLNGQVTFHPTHRCTKCGTEKILARLVATFPHDAGDCGGTWQPLEVEPKGQPSLEAEDGIRTWEWTEGRGKRGVGQKVTTLTHKPDGWPRDSSDPIDRPWQVCSSILNRRLNGLPACEAKVVWKIETQHQHMLRLAHYCDEDLPAEYRQEVER